VTLLVDGPTSTLLSWVFERMLRHPAMLARLREEVSAGDEDTYLDAVIKETMRLCPGAPIVVRKLLAPMELGGYTIPAGTTVAPCVHLVHRREDVYPRPGEFIPERFLDKPAGTYTWIPVRGRCAPLSSGELRSGADEAGDPYGPARDGPASGQATLGTPGQKRDRLRTTQARARDRHATGHARLGRYPQRRH
jgi:hypothetical protein